MMRLYNAALVPLRLAVSAWAALPLHRPEVARRWRERLARRLPEADSGGIWVHGASVGEARITAALSAAVRPRFPWIPVCVSATTATGRAQLPTPPAVAAAFYAPFDFRGLPGRVLDRLRPAALILVETELWPNLLGEAADRGVPVAVVNARLSADRMAAYRRLDRLYRPLLARLAAVGAQSGGDAERFVALGVPEGRIRVTGNVKYDLPAAAADRVSVRAELAIGSERPVVVAGSTADGEDAAVLAAASSVQRRWGDLLLILAPRHPARADDVARLVQRRGLRLRRWSREPSGRETDVLLVDEVGHLARLYAAADVAFVGGSLVAVGGHNVLEPAAAGAPVLFGPFTASVAEPADELVRRGGALRVQDAEALAEAVSTLLADRERARELTRAAAAVLAENRGALSRTLEMLESVLPPRPEKAAGRR